MQFEFLYWLVCPLHGRLFYRPRWIRTALLGARLHRTRDGCPLAYGRQDGV